jgi:hypothetical protein
LRSPGTAGGSLPRSASNARSASSLWPGSPPRGPVLWSSSHHRSLRVPWPAPRPGASGCRSSVSGSPGWPAPAPGQTLRALRKLGAHQRRRG